MLRRLLNIASIVCLVLCVALMGMWVRSYRWSDHFSGRMTETRVFIVVLESGRILWRLESGRTVGRYESPMRNEPRPDWAWRTTSYPIGSFEIPRVHGGWSTGFGFLMKSDAISLQETVSSVVLPYWFLVLTSGSLAMAFQFPWPPRFTLRSLFIVTTFLAVVLGMIAWLDRAWIGK
jgi:hypothetical protein